MCDANGGCERGMDSYIDTVLITENMKKKKHHCFKLKVSNILSSEPRTEYSKSSHSWDKDFTQGTNAD